MEQTPLEVPESFNDRVRHQMIRITQMSEGEAQVLMTEYADLVQRLYSDGQSYCDIAGHVLDQMRDEAEPPGPGLWGW